MIDDRTLSMQEARKAGMLEGLTREQIQDRANRRRDMRAAGKAAPAALALTSEEKAAREAVCKECEALKGNRCVDVHKKQGCGACSMPWQSAYVTCPRGKWNL